MVQTFFELHHKSKTKYKFYNCTYTIDWNYYISMSTGSGLSVSFVHYWIKFKLASSPIQEILCRYPEQQLTDLTAKHAICNHQIFPLGFTGSLLSIFTGDNLNFNPEIR